MTAASAKAALVMMPFRIRGYSIMDIFDESFARIFPRLPVTLLVKAAEDIDLDAEPEEGVAGEMAAAADTLSDSEKKAEEAQKNVESMQEKLREWLEKIDRLETTAETEEVQKELRDARDALKQAEAETVTAVRKAAKAQAKAEDAERAAATLGLKTED